MKPKPYMNPYMAGILLGMVLLATIYITGRGVGASGGFKSIAMSTVKQSTPAHWEQGAYYQNFEATSNGESPLKSWLLFEIVGV